MKEEKSYITGLNAAEVAESRAKYGENTLTPPERESMWLLFLEKFNDPIIRILLVAAFVSLAMAFVTGHFAETIGIFFAIILATAIGFWFEYDAARKFDVLNMVNDDTPIKVVREGRVVEIAKREVVVGDTVVLATGEEVPADGHLFQTVALHINESTLTGEPMIGKTHLEAEFDEEATYPSNMVLRGTTVIEGSGTMVVSAVGDATELGKVATKSTEKTEQETPLNKQLERLAKLIGFIGFSISILTFIILLVKELFFAGNGHTLGQIGLIGALMAAVAVMMIKIWLPLIYDGFMLFGREKSVPRVVASWGWAAWIGLGVLTFCAISAVGLLFGVNPVAAESWVDLEAGSRILSYFMVAVTLIVVSVPEGLPMSVTLSLALNMRRMLKTNNLVRKMHACETMGAITVICTDKTGTLTQNQMRVYNTDILVDDAPYIYEGVAINSTAFLDLAEVEKPKTIGNPTEAALLLWMHGKGINYEQLRESVKVVDQLSFSTERKYMATIVESAALAGRRVLYVKGAPEIVMGYCADVPRAEMDAKLLGYQNQAMRTLGIAYRIVDETAVDCATEVTRGGLTLIGIIAISDPVREDVPQAVGQCLSAGIGVKIVTGDTPGTATEIARQIGLWNDATDTDLNRITGVEFAELTDEQALGRVQALKIMSRARPMDKQRLVHLLQQCGEVVAVTGDGTNDAPALNFAQVGLSMGTGTSVAKEASDITLLDDSFNSIATAVMWGRSLYLNIQRFVMFQLTINVVALIIVCLGVFFGTELPLTVTQMLWVNLIMDTFAAGALASLSPSRRLMERKPRGINDFIISPVMSRNILTTGALFVVLLLGLLWFFENNEIYSRGYSMTMFFSIFVMFQFWNLFNAKAFGSGRSAFADMKKSMGFVAVMVAILAGQIVIVTVGGEIFRVEPLEIKDWLIIILGTSPIMIIPEIGRLLKAKRA